MALSPMAVYELVRAFLQEHGGNAAPKRRGVKLFDVAELGPVLFGSHDDDGGPTIATYEPFNWGVGVLKEGDTRDPNARGYPFIERFANGMLEAHWRGPDEQVCIVQPGLARVYFSSASPLTTNPYDLMLWLSGIFPARTGSQTHVSASINELDGTGTFAILFRGRVTSPSDPGYSGWKLRYHEGSGTISLHYAEEGADNIEATHAEPGPVSGLWALFTSTQITYGFTSGGVDTTLGVVNDSREGEGFVGLCFEDTDGACGTFTVEAE